ncbi:MAG: alpha-1,4-glucan--maltose-1-phosphate maltosyltransferase [Acidobacteria bacterium]|nr:alpha-1,4-glucan--maltose-1-phosphate maltosyltransferase [Acidobacteriota bacterium]
MLRETPKGVILAEYPDEGRKRVVIAAVEPTVDGGRFAVKRVVGDRVEVTADIFADGHESVGARLLWRKSGEKEWSSAPMAHRDNDRWAGELAVDAIGRWEFTVEAWIDRYLGWSRDMEKRIAAGQDLAVQYLVAAELIDRVIDLRKLPKADAAALKEWAATFRDETIPDADKTDRLVSGDLDELMERHPDDRHAYRLEPGYPIWVDRELAGFSAWYEMFPRSTGKRGEHGTFRTAAERFSYVRELGFDIVYLPPIHPIGVSFRKGKNNTLEPGKEDVGSPWAIGGREGGHTAIHPELGTLEDFRWFVKEARKYDLEVALDIAFQASPDHPWVTEHPEWFRKLPDGSIQYAENPPKKYQDIYPIDFDSEDWRGLWDALRDVMLFWAGEKVRVFRVDNPHTKALGFWEWAIAEIRDEYPDVIFLSEAFTRPKVMYHLAKVGFTQSYTYFTWRNSKPEMEEYLRELTSVPVVDFFRPNFWPNTPDILHADLQTGGRGMFMTRLMLASLLSSNYGIYGPAFELLEHLPVREGSEEYLDSEKYQIRRWDLDREESLRWLIARINRIRRANAALQSNRSLRFHRFSNDQITCFSKRTKDFANVILCFVSFDPRHVQAGSTRLDMAELGLDPGERFTVHDLVTGARYDWHGLENYVELNPHVMPGHIFEVQRRKPSDAAGAGDGG